MNKFGTRLGRGYIALLAAVVLIFSSYKNSLAAQETQASAEDSMSAAISKEDCASFTGSYDFGSFDSQKDAKARLHELKCAYKRGDDLKTIADKNNENLLLDASDKGDLESVKVLVELAKIDVNAKDNSGSTALSQASKHDYLEVVQYLVAQGADVTLNGAACSKAKGSHAKAIKAALHDCK